MRPDLIVLTGGKSRAAIPSPRNVHLPPSGSLRIFLRRRACRSPWCPARHDDRGTGTTKEMQPAVYTEYGVNLARDENGLYGCAAAFFVRLFIMAR